VASNIGLTPKTVWLVSQRYQQGGLERALYERPRPGKAALLDAGQRQRNIALACSQPPACSPASASGGGASQIRPFSAAKPAPGIAASIATALPFSGILLASSLAKSSPT